MSSKMCNFKASILKPLAVMILILSTLIAYAQMQPTDLTGRWDSNDGGTYFIEQKGDTVWCREENSSKGSLWSNEARGNITGTIIRLYWLNKSNNYSKNMISRVLILDILSPNKLILENKTEEFGGSIWVRENLSIPDRSTRSRDSQVQPFARPGSGFSESIEINQSSRSFDKYPKSSKYF